MTEDKIKEASTRLKKNGRMTLIDKKSEAHSKLYIKAVEDIEVIEVDHVLISDTIQRQRKSDFTIWAKGANKTHIIELKGKNIEEAFDQVSETIHFFSNSAETKKLVNGCKVLNAYIVSPNNQKVPAIASKEEKNLAKLLLARSKDRPTDMFRLIHFVKVVSRQKKLAMNGRQILTSNEAPLEFGL